MLAVGLCWVAGCNKASAPAKAPSDPAFDQKWVSLAKSGTDPLIIESDEHGAGLMGELRRATEPAGGPILKDAPEVKGELPDDQVIRVIRANLPKVKGCYLVAEKSGQVGSGKAIVSVEIAPTGAVSTVQVDAPVFQGSSLPSCMTQTAKTWTFPKFTQGPKHFSYPFVFVGG
jgi:hypothetical protein